MSRPASGAAFAAAKVNLYLHVGALDADGFHPLSSLMVFADVGDRLGLRAGEALGLSVGGRFGEGLGAGEDNLVLRAARALIAAIDTAPPRFCLTLTKDLPLAAGLGGGSSDAGAVLRLIRDTMAPQVDDAALEAIAVSLGSDGAACLWARPVIAEGRGERLSPAPRLPRLDAVLVNPLVASPTGPVYRAYDATGAPGGADRPAMPKAFESAEELAGFLALCRNDLEAPAASLAPAIGDVLETLRSEPETLLARVSGSGATCFALCAGDIEAKTLTERLERMRPGWWVRRCRLGGPELFD
jgi:4-diphosphocytidyl-2-C-methyl-D-erythritol kinase